MKSEKLSASESTTALKPKPKRNGKIECFRFVFAILVMLMHTYSHTVGLPAFKSLKLFPLPPHGAVAVEFFFLVSGFLMAKSAYKSVTNNGLRLDSDKLSLESVRFMRNKIRTIFPYHIVAFVLVFIAYVLLKNFGWYETVLDFVKSLPNLFLAYMLGMPSSTPNPPEWYLSVTLISMVIIYPLLRKYYYKFTRFIGPLLALLILAVIFIKTRSLSGVKTEVFFAYKGTLRGFAELLLGAMGFEICRFLQGKKIPAFVKFLFTLFEFAAYLAVVVFAFTAAPKEYEFVALALLFVAIPITFSNQTYLNRLFNNKFFYFLGKISFYIYLCHMCPVFIAENYMADIQLRYKVLFVVAVTAALIFIVEYGGKFILKLADKRNQKAAA